MLIALRWIGSGFTGALGGLQALAFAALLTVAAAAGGYVYGRLDGYVIHKVEALNAAVRELTARAEAAEEVAKTAEKLSKAALQNDDDNADHFKNAEKIIDRAVDAGVCADVDFLRSLNRAR